jgi:hypothetical protein
VRSVLLIILILNSALGFAQEAEFFVKGSTYKFPDAKEGEQLEHVFTVTNTGEKPLLISAYTVECSCTKAYFPKDPIPPGGSSQLKITFDTEGKSYFQDRIVYFTTNTKRKKEKLRFKVFVSPK